MKFFYTLLCFIREKYHSAFAGERISSSLITVHVRQIGDFDFEIHQLPDKYISGDLRRDHVWEPFETNVFCRLCKEGDFVLDIGANIGWYTVIASKLVGVNGKVVSFEPDPVNRILLKRNISLASSGSVEVKGMALGGNEAMAKLFLSDNNLGDHRLFDDGGDRGSLDVCVQSLDSLYANETYLPTLVKSDTQGSEGLIFKGASRLFSNGWRPIWLIEFWPYGLINSGQDPMALWVMLKELGYRMFELSEGNPTLVELNQARVTKRLRTDISEKSQGFINILALPDDCDRIESIQDLILSSDEMSL